MPRYKTRGARIMEQLEYGPGKALVTCDPALAKTFRLVREVLAPSNIPVLIQGETGTGKEGIARGIHHHGPRASRPFVPGNCGALPVGLAESLLFGHEKGAFTGATARRIGLFEAADGGTLFLDEIGDLPLDLQPKLLRAIQEGEVVRVGAVRQVQVDVRIVAATNRDLGAMARDGRFREDLFYRLRGEVVEMPPLRRRPDDVRLLAERFAREAGKRKNLTIAPAVLAALGSHSWPGNVRELQGVLLAAATRCAALAAGVIAVEHLPGWFAPARRERLRPYRVAELRQAILEHLGREGSTTIAVIARALGRDRNAVRRQVTELEAARSVAVERVRGSRGSRVSRL